MTLELAFHEAFRGRLEACQNSPFLHEANSFRLTGGYSFGATQGLKQVGDMPAFNHIPALKPAHVFYAAKYRRVSDPDSSEPDHLAMQTTESNILKVKHRERDMIVKLRVQTRRLRFLETVLRTGEARPCQQVEGF